MSSRIVAIGMTSLSLLLFGGCRAVLGIEEPLDPAPPPCGLNSDCADPLVCANGTCRTACEVSRDCPAGQRCMATDKPFHACQLAITETACRYNSDCPAGQICGVDLQCGDQCQTDRECVVGQNCVLGTCSARSLLCVLNEQCPPSLICVQNACVPVCQMDHDCVMGQRCVMASTGSACLMTPAGPSDAGATVRDAGRDAAPRARDAGRDAAPRARDAGRDAGLKVRDAGKDTGSP